MEEMNERKAAKTTKDLGSNNLPLSQHLEDPLHASAGGQAPLLSLLENSLWTRTEAKQSSNSSAARTSSANVTSIEDSRAVIAKPESNESAKSETIRQTLAAAIPSKTILQEAANKNKSWWAALRTRTHGPNAAFEQTCLEAYISSALSRGPPTQIARVIQLVAKLVDEAIVHNLLLLIDRLILFDDEYMCTMEGLECALFQGMLYSDMGQARRSWIIYRRALTFSHLMGLHRIRTDVWQDMIWWGLFQADRFSSLLIGVPYAVGDALCDMNFRGKQLSLDTTTHGLFCKLAIMSGKVIDRTHQMQESSYSALLGIDHEITQIGAQMPNSFWQLSHVAPKDMLQAGEWQERALGQVIYHQTKLILHIPYLLKSFRNTEYRYSRDLCFENARSLVRLFHKMRAEVNTHAYKTRVVDFIAFMATLILVLGVFGYGQMEDDHKQQEDWMFIESTLGIFKRVSAESFGKVADQCYRALLELTSFYRNGTEADQNTEKRVAIPFFGTISVQVSAQKMGSEADPKRPLQNIPSSHPPMYPEIVYDGLYTQPSSNENSSFGPDSTGYTQPPLEGQTYWNFDLDQDWSWLTCDTSAPTMPYQ
jgi:hypothetical protein